MDAVVFDIGEIRAVIAQEIATQRRLKEVDIPSLALGGVAVLAWLCTPPPLPETKEAARHSKKEQLTSVMELSRA